MFILPIFLEIFPNWLFSYKELMYVLNYETRPVNNSAYATYTSVKVSGFPVKINESKVKEVFTGLSTPVNITKVEIRNAEKKPIVIITFENNLQCSTVISERNGYNYRVGKIKLEFYKAKVM